MTSQRSYLFANLIVSLTGKSVCGSMITGAGTTHERPLPPTSIKPVQSRAPRRPPIGAGVTWYGSPDLPCG
jgi:hypothetical protein